MDINNHTTNIHPYGTGDGTSFARKHTNDVSKIDVPKSDDKLTSNKVDSSKKNLHEANSDKGKKHVVLKKSERDKMVEEMNKFVSNFYHGVSFRVDKASGKDVTTVYEKKSGDIIRQYPDKDMLKIYRRLAHPTENNIGLLSEKV